MNTTFDFNADATELARALIGATLLVNGVGGLIVETEAYDQEEPAAHSFGGPTRRNANLYGPPGHVYVYKSHGLHWCFNIVCRETGHGAGVLVRALEPLVGLEAMQARRGTEVPRLLCAGPGRLTQALAISNAHNGLAIDAAPLTLSAPPCPPKVIVGPRIGITHAVDLPWRFGLAGSVFVSRRFPVA